MNVMVKEMCSSPKESVDEISLTDPVELRLLKFKPQTPRETRADGTEINATPGDGERSASGGANCVCDL